jgi:cation:H+ antiporter
LAAQRVNMVILNFLVFAICSLILVFASKKIIDSLLKIGVFLKWKEFVVTFLIVSLSVSLPNFLVGITSAIKKVPELSFGDVIGGNIVAMTLMLALATLLSRGGLSLPSKTVQGSVIFAVFIGILPVILSGDGKLSRAEGIFLIFTFLFYVFWLFSEKERFLKDYQIQKNELNFHTFFNNLLLLFFLLLISIFSANGIVKSVLFFGEKFQIPNILTGILLLSLGNNLPELFFLIEAARKNQDWVIMGDLVGGIIVTSTLVLGTVSLISPISISNSSFAFVVGIFLIFCALLFWRVVRSGKKVTKNEALVLLFTYLIFITIELFLK